MAGMPQPYTGVADNVTLKECLSLTLAAEAGRDSHDGARMKGAELQDRLPQLRPWETTLLTITQFEQAFRSYQTSEDRSCGSASPSAALVGRDDEATPHPTAESRRHLFGGRRVNRRPDSSDAVCREAGRLSMLVDQIFAWGSVNAVDLVISDIAMDPLNVRPQITQYVARSLRRAFQLVCT